MMRLPLIFLIGPRGSGKTTVARLLAERLGWSWCDADAILEERFGRSIRDIFAEDGEDGFRAKEMEILAELVQRCNHVIATGGGVVIREANQVRLKSGFVVWLTADPKVLLARVADDASTYHRRPPLAQGGLDEVRDILQGRQPLYQQCADLTLDTTQLGPQEAVQSILQAMGERGA